VSKRIVDVDYLQSLLSKATPGLWTWEDDPPTVYAGRDGDHHGWNLLGRLDVDVNGANNLNLLCAAVNALPTLLEEARAHAETRARYDEVCQECDALRLKLADLDEFSKHALASGYMKGIKHAQEEVERVWTDRDALQGWKDEAMAVLNEHDDLARNYCQEFGLGGLGQSVVRVALDDARAVRAERDALKTKLAEVRERRIETDDAWVKSKQAEYAAALGARTIQAEPAREAEARGMEKFAVWLPMQAVRLGKIPNADEVMAYIAAHRAGRATCKEPLQVPGEGPRHPATAGRLDKRPDAAGVPPPETKEE